MTNKLSTESKTISYLGGEVISSGGDGWFVDHGLSISLSVKEASLCHKKSDYFVVNPHIKFKTKEHKNDDDDDDTTKRKRKKKQHHVKNMHEENAELVHISVTEIIHKRAQTILSKAKEQHYLKSSVEIEQKGDNENSLNIDSHSFAAVYNIESLNGLLIEHPHKSPSLLHNDQSTFVIPALSQFLLSDDLQLKPIVDSGKKFQLIVIDPPWENKSVKRSKRYSMLPSSQLQFLPVDKICTDDAIVVVWVTNKRQFHDCVVNELFPNWGCQLIAEWFWVKVTQEGEYVFDLSSTHKRTYEPILIGQFKNKTRKEEQLETKKFLSKPIDNNMVVCSIPSKAHSRKPHIGELIKTHYFDNKETVNCLELFARNLLPNWTSWGNEVLKFQEISYFQEADKDDTQQHK